MTLRSLALLLLLIAPAAFAVDVEGYVYTLEGAPVAKATVVAGSQRVTTGDDGHFTLTAPPDSILAIEVQAQSFSSQKLFALAGDPPLTVTLRPEEDGVVRASGLPPGEQARGPHYTTLTGIVRIGKKPLAFAPVSITAVSEQYSEPVDVRADDKGRYRISVAPGRYVVGTDRNLAPRLQSIHANRMWEGDGPLVADTSKSAETVKDIELVAPPLITGRVVDAAGKPVARADVLVVLPGRPPFEFFYQPIVRTLPDGTFAVVRPPFEERQPFELMVTPPGHSSTPSTETTIKLPRFETVTVRVTDRDGKPLPDAVVAYGEADELRESGSQILLMPHITRRRMHADAKGEVTLHLTPGAYEFAAMAPKYQSRTVAQTIAKAGSVAIALEIGATIRGRVHQGERPVAGADVSIRGGPDVRRSEKRTSTDAKGLFTFESLAPGRYQLAVLKQDELIDRMLTIDAPGEIDVQLPPAATLTGKVLDAETGAPIPQFYLTIEPPEDGARRQIPGQSYRSESSADGAFAITVPAGSYRVAAGANGYLASEPVDVQLTERASTPLELRLDRGAVVTGRVSDDDGKPVADVNVMVAPDSDAIYRSARPTMRSGIASAQTAEDGTFTVSGLEPGPAQLIVRGSGFVMQRKALDVVPETQVDVTLTRGLGVTGVVTMSGKPVAGATVSASTPAIGSDHQSVQTDERGRFTLEGLLAARYTISATYDETSGEVPNVDVGQRREIAIELDGKSKAVIYGAVTGMPRGGGKVTRGHVFAQGGSKGAEATLDATGNYRIENAPTGSVLVSVDVQTAVGGTTARKQVDVAPGQSVRVDLDLTPAAIVSGRVTHNGRPVPRPNVTFLSEEHGFIAATPRDDGTYEVGLPATGRYQIHASADAVASHPFQTVRDIRGSETFDIVLDEQTIEGTVVDAETRQPIQGAVVSLMLRGGTRQVMVSSESLTDATGRFSMVTGAFGPHLLMASANGFSQRTQDVTLGGPEPIRARFELVPAVQLRVRVVDARNGTPLEAHVVVIDERGQPLPLRGARVGVGGEITFSVAPGRYKVTAITAGYAEKTVEVSAPGSAVLSLE